MGHFRPVKGEAMEWTPDTDIYRDPPTPDLRTAADAQLATIRHARHMALIQRVTEDRTELRARVTSRATDDIGRYLVTLGSIEGGEWTLTQDGASYLRAAVAAGWESPGFYFYSAPLAEALRDLRAFRAVNGLL